MVTKSQFQKAISKTKTLFDQTSPEPRIFKLSVKKRFQGYSLLKLYSESFPHVETSYWQSKIDSGNLTVDGKQVSPSYEVNAGQITQHSVPPKKEPNVSFHIELIAATENYWVLNKPSPLPVHAGGRYEKHTLTHILKTSFPKQHFHLINRLDANTTGVILVALNKETAQDVGKQFKNREVSKTYLAMVKNIPSSKFFESNSAISKSKTAAGGRKLEDGQESNTDFEVIKTFEDSTLLKVIPHSGRTNQIRLHLAGLKLPIIGDLGYEDPEYFQNNPLTYPTDSLFLHSWKLSFTHDKERKNYIAPANQKWFNYL